jgi:thioredoxin
MNRRIILVTLLIIALLGTLAALGNKGATGSSSGGGGGKVAVLDSAGFDAKAKGSLLIVDFYADWCGPCRAFEPTFKQVAADAPTISFVKVDVDASSDLAQRYGIRAIPYIAAIKDGKVVAQYQGNRTAADFKAWSERMQAAHGK